MTYQLTIHIDSPEADENAANDDLVVQIISGTPIFLPVTTR